MTISFVAGNTGSTGNTAYNSSYTVAKPTNTNGDLVVAIVAGVGATVSGSGWTLLMKSTARGGGSMDQTSVYYKIASSEGTGSYTVSLTGAQIAGGWIGAYRGVDQTTPIDTTHNGVVWIGGTTTSFSPTSITAALDNWGIAFGVGYGATGTLATYSQSGSPAVSFERADFGPHTGSENTAIVIAEFDSLSAGAFAPTVTRSASALTGDKGSFLILSAGISASAEVAPAVACAALDATILIQTVQVSPVAVTVNDAAVTLVAPTELVTVSLATYDASRPMLPDAVTVAGDAYDATMGIFSEVVTADIEAYDATRPIFPGVAVDVVCDAKDAKVLIAPNSEVSEVAIYVPQLIVYFGASTVRSFMVPGENRIYTMRYENRVFKIQRG